MVDPIQLTNDILSNAVSLALPGVLWALLYLLAWEHEPFAESIGFGRRTFWLLLPGALLASFAILPIAPVSTDVVAVSFAGAVFPLLVGLLAFGRVASPRARSLSRYLSLLAMEGALLFVMVLPATAGFSNALAGLFGVSSYIGNEIAVFLVAAAFSAVVGGVAFVSGDALSKRVAFLLALTSAVLVLTFVGSSAVPGVGIEEQFPYFLLPPVAAGLVAAAFARWVFPGEAGYAIPTAFLGSTFGVLLGADLLRQPPLYGTGPSGLYTIGGAGVLDLVYLSGLIAFGAAYLGYRATVTGFAPVGAPLPPRVVPPTARLHRAFRSGLDGRLSDSLTEASGASHAAASQARGLFGLGPTTEARPWEGLPVPGWVVADQANLDAAAKAGTQDGREGFRSWLTARWLVYIGRDLSARRFGTIFARSVAFLIDLAVVTAPAALIWAIMLQQIPGGLDDALENIGFNAAIYGFIAWAFLYFVLAETFAQTTVGKWLLGLEVRERALAPTSGISALVRNATVLPVLTVLGIGVAIALAFGLKNGISGSLSLSGVALPSGLVELVGALVFVLGGVALLGGVGILFIAATSERQRLGDLWAGTWVVRRSPPVPSGGTAPSGAAPSPPPAAPGAGRSG